MIVIALIAATAGLVVSNQYFSKKETLPLQSLLVYPDKKTFTGFKLTNQDNKQITIDDFSGKWTLMFFGFTHCPDDCPTTLTELQKTFKFITTKEKPEVLFVSVDGERDTPKIL